MIQNDKDAWAGLDVWWNKNNHHLSIHETAEDSVVIADRWVVDSWKQMDPWWGVHADTHLKLVEEAQEQITKTHNLWGDGTTRYEQDPLCIDWRDQNEGPLRTNHEENWSQWLAHLVRTAPQSFHTTLFDRDLSDGIQAVEREVFLRDSEKSNRRADVVIFHEADPLSIEVKIDDTHYSKTTHTVSLLEETYPMKWNHYLLLPEYQLPKLQQARQIRFEEREDEQIIITDETKNITVITWRDIGLALRKTLCNREELSPHWEASAYLFCTLIEQKILDFVPEPVIDQIDESTDVVKSPLRYGDANSTIIDQNTYLEKTGDTDE